MKWLLLMLLAQPAWGLSPVEEKAERHYQAGLEMAAKSRPKDALTELGVAAQLAPERADIKDAISRIQGGAAPAQPAVPESSKKVAPILKEAREAYYLSELNHAADAWNRVLLLDQDNAEAKAGLARLAEEAYKKDPDQPFDSSVKDLYDLALREARKERYVEAKKKLEEALALNPAQAQVKELLARIAAGAFAQSGNREADAALREGGRALEAGEWAAARQAYERALALRPEDKAVLDGLARLHEKAAPAVKELLDKAGNSPDDELALSVYRQALAIEPQDAQIREASEKAEARLKKNQGKASLKQKADALYNQGVEAWQAGRLAEAASRFKETLELAPGDAEAAKALETVHSKLSAQVDKDKAAVASLVKAAADLEEKGKLKEALAAYERALANDPSRSQTQAAVTRLKEALHVK